MFAASNTIRGARTAGFVERTLLDAGRLGWSSSTGDAQRTTLLGTGAPGAAASPEGLVTPWGTGVGDRGVGGELFRPHRNAVSLRAFFLSSEGTGPNSRSSQRNFVLCTTVDSLCLEKSVRKACLCVKHARVRQC